MISSRFGNPIGTDFTKTHKAGSSFLGHTYIVKYEKHAVRYVCQFYKPQNIWIVKSVVWDDDTASLFKEWLTLRSFGHKLRCVSFAPHSLVVMWQGSKEMWPLAHLTIFMSNFF